MRLFSFRKKKPSKGFAFLIQDVFALNGGGAVVAGQVTEGSICPGDQAVCVPGAGNAFLCAIDVIEQPDPKRQGQFIHPKEARADGPFNGRYSLLIPGRSQSDFRPGDRLLPMGSVPLDEPAVLSPEPCTGFLFQIEHIFSIRNVGTAVVGMVLNGSAGIGDTVSYGHVQGEAVFTSSIKAIDGKGSMDSRIAPVERATADGPCQCGCALTLDEPDARRFQAGGYMFIL